MKNVLFCEQKNLRVADFFNIIESLFGTIII